MEHFRFFNSTAEDPREYLASEFAEYFNRFLSDGLYSQNGNAGLKVTFGSGLGVVVQPGYAFIRGYMYHNDENLTKTLEAADAMLDRIDRIVIRFDEVAREIRIHVKKGTPSSSPAVPALTDETYIKELGLAQVRVRKGSASIVSSDITDERLTSACGLVSSLITIPAQEMWDVWNNALSDIQAAWANDEENIITQWQQIKLAWENWFDSVQNVLGVRVMIGEVEPPDLESGDLWFREV